jgi:Fe2+ transport system protein FeoA
MRDFEWPSGSCLRLLAYGAIDKAYRSQLLVQGLTKGVLIRVIRYAAFGGPVQIELRGVMLVLNREALHRMQWEQVL